MKRYLGTITTDDVTTRRNWALWPAMGRLLPGDVGKRYYLVDGVVQVENDEQRDARLRRIDKGE